MLYGIIAAAVIWLLLYGLNIPLRAWLQARHAAKHDVVLRVELQQPKERLTSGFRYSLIAAAFALLAAFWREFRFDFWSGLELGLVIFVLAWPLYLRSKARSTEIFILDRDGMTVFPPRTGRVGTGTFQTRIEWKDCFGYSMFRGTVLFALLPFGHVEQEYGALREQVEDALYRLGIPKLVSYDMLDRAEISDDGLEEMSQHVETLAIEVVGGYSGELSALGVRIEVERMFGTDEQSENAFSYLRMKLMTGEELLRDLDWLLWAKYEHSMEVLRLPGERLYEALDERVQSLIDFRLQELELDKAPPHVH